MGKKQQYYHLEELIIIGIVLIVAIFSLVLIIQPSPPIKETIGEAKIQPSTQLKEVEIKNIEMIKTECNDGVDNDNDKFVDMDDKDCIASLDNSETSTNECFDTDGGFFIDKRGNVYGIANNDLYDMDDKCIDSISLKENVCVGKEPDTTTINCKEFDYNFCVDGRCV